MQNDFGSSSPVNPKVKTSSSFKRVIKRLLWVVSDGATFESLVSNTDKAEPYNK